MKRSAAVARSLFSPRFRLPLLAGLAIGLLAGCSSQSRMDFYSKDIACEELGQQWSMPDSHGTVRGPKDLQGQVTYLFFGFTSCPDVCPTTMVELSQVKHLMGKDADQLQVVFVSVDPARDTPEVARTYVEAFDPKAIALVGNEAQLAAMASDFKAFYEKEPGQVPETYTMSHIAGGYVFDRQGRLRLFAPYGMPVDKLFSDVQRLLLEPGHPAAGNDALASCHLYRRCRDPRCLRPKPRRQFCRGGLRGRDEREGRSRSQNKHPCAPFLNNVVVRNHR